MHVGTEIPFPTILCGGSLLGHRVGTYSDTIKGFKMILDGECDDLAENDLYMRVHRNGLGNRTDVMPLSLEIITPDRKILETPADQVVLPTESGSRNSSRSHALLTAGSR